MAWLSHIIQFIITTAGVFIALVFSNLSERNREKETSNALSDALKDEMKRNIRILNLIRANIINCKKNPADQQPHQYSLSVWNALIGSGMLFNCKKLGISIPIMSNLYTKIQYGNFVEDMLFDLYLIKAQNQNWSQQNNNIYLLDHILETRKKHADKIEKAINAIGLVSLNDGYDVESYI